MQDAPWWHFWSPDSSLVGNILAGLVFSLAAVALIVVSIAIARAMAAA